MLSNVYYEDVFLEKQKFNQEQDASYSTQFMKILLVFFALFLIWNGYSHYKQNELVHNGTAVLAKISTFGDDKYFSFTAADGTTYEKHLSGMFVALTNEEGATRINQISNFFSPEPGDTVIVYYLDDPADATPLTAPYFFYAMYAISIIGIAVALWRIIRGREVIRNNRSPEQEKI